MAESRVNPQNFYVVQGWMVSDLGLKGHELAVYAIITAFHKLNSNITPVQHNITISSRLDSKHKENRSHCTQIPCRKGLYRKTRAHRKRREIL